MNAQLRVLRSEMLYRVKPYPWFATIELTTRCNSNCSYCVRNKSPVPNSDIKLETLSYILKALQQTKVEKITLGGWGEPSLHADFDIIIDLIKMKLPKAKIKIFTNGLLIDEKSTSFMKLDEITVSLNHDSSDTYAKYNRIDKYDRVASNIESFLKLKGNRHPSVSVQLLKTPEANELAFTNKWLPLLNRNDHLIFQPLESQPIVPSEFYPCYDARTLLMISLSGNAYCCCRSWTAGEKSDIYLGNLVKQPMSKILDSLNLRKVQSTQTNGERSKLNPCSHCDIWVKNKNQYCKLNNKWRLA